MFTMDSTQFWMIAGGSLIMALVVLRAIGNGAVAVASGMVEDRRTIEAQRKVDNAIAEAAGRAAALEPLNLNPDGSIEEPIIGVVETP